MGSVGAYWGNAHMVQGPQMGDGAAKEPQSGWRLPRGTGQCTGVFRSEERMEGWLTRVPYGVR